MYRRLISSCRVSTIGSPNLGSAPGFDVWVGFASPVRRRTRSLATIGHPWRMSAILRLCEAGSRTLLHVFEPTYVTSWKSGLVTFHCRSLLLLVVLLVLGSLPELAPIRVAFANLSS